MAFFNHECLDSMEKIPYSYKLSDDAEEILSNDGSVGLSKLLFKIDDGEYKGVVFSISDFDDNKLNSDGVLSFVPVFYKTDDERLNDEIVNYSNDLQKAVIWVVDDFFAAILQSYINEYDKGK